MTPPNILWVITTQWRAQAMGYAGDTNARTPHLDRLAAQAINFSQAVTPHPFGPWARAAMLTGKLSPENGVRDYFDPLPLGAKTIAHELAERGYDTAFFGKWQLWKRDPRAPLVGLEHAKIKVPVEARGGFAYWEGFESGFLLNDPWLHGTSASEPQEFIGYQSEVLVDRWQAWLQARGEPTAPWFSVVSMEAPHPPYGAAANGHHGPTASEISLPTNVPCGGDVEQMARREMAGYYAHIAATDAAIGRLLATMPENTLVVFTSVHGDMHGAHGLFRKGWPYEEAIRVPLLVKLPGKSAGRATVDTRAISLVNLSQLTLGYALGGGWTARAEYAAISMPSVVNLPHQCDRVWRGVRSAQRKLIVTADGRPWLFFDLEKDPGENINRVDLLEAQSEITRLRALLTEEN